MGGDDRPIAAPIITEKACSMPGSKIMGFGKHLLAQKNVVKRNNLLRACVCVCVSGKPLETKQEEKRGVFFLFFFYLFFFFLVFFVFIYLFIYLFFFMSRLR